MNNFLKIRVESYGNGLFDNYYVMVNHEKIYSFTVFYDGFTFDIKSEEKWFEFMFDDYYTHYGSMVMRGTLPANKKAREMVMKCIEMYFMDR